MKNTFSIVIIFLVTLTVSAQENVESLFKLKWKADIGITTYRSNMIHQDGKLYIGSNGADRNSYNDEKDGVYILDPSNGTTVRHIKSELLGDNDVNGVVVYKDRIYFGSDNYHFYCYNIDGSELWRYETEYDVESCPVLTKVNEDSEPDVVFTVEGRGLVALDGLTGKELWKFHTDYYRGYNGSPSVYDLNGDGTNDLMIGGEGNPSSNEVLAWKMAYYGDFFYSIDGTYGGILWKEETGSKIHASPLVTESNGKVEVIFSSCYGETNFLDKKGKFIKGINVGIGAFSSPILSSTGDYLCIGHSWSGSEDYFSIEPISSKHFSPNQGGYLNGNDLQASESKGYTTGKMSASAVVADVMGNGKQQLINCSESGLLLITEEDGTLIKQLNFPIGAEASPMVKDIDGDGFLELLISSLDGNLYCYETKSKGKVHWGQFRGDNSNSGVMRLK